MKGELEVYCRNRGVDLKPKHNLTLQLTHRTGAGRVQLQMQRLGDRCCGHEEFSGK